MEPSGTELALGQSSRGQRFIPKKKKEGEKKRATTSEFLTALELMWGTKFGGFTGTLGLSRSDLNPECCLGALQQLSGTCAGHNPGYAGSVTHQDLLLQASLPSNPGHPTEPARAQGMSGARGLMPQLWVPHHGLTGATLPSPAMNSCVLQPL